MLTAPRADPTHVDTTNNVQQTIRVMGTSCAGAAPPGSRTPGVWSMQGLRRRGRGSSRTRSAVPCPVPARPPPAGRRGELRSVRASDRGQRALRRRGAELDDLLGAMVVGPGEAAQVGLDADVGGDRPVVAELVPE